jgi:hypothetical protein
MPSDNPAHVASSVIKLKLPDYFRLPLLSVKLKVKNVTDEIHINLDS